MVVVVARLIFDTEQTKCMCYKGIRVILDNPQTYIGTLWLHAMSYMVVNPAITYTLRRVVDDKQIQEPAYIESSISS